MFQIKVKQLREQRGLSQAALAKSLGVKQSTVGMWESGANGPKYNMLLKIASFFNVSVSELVGDVPTSKNGVPYDPDTVAAMEEAFERPEIRALFSVSKNATKEDIEKTIAIIKALKGDDCAE